MTARYTRWWSCLLILMAAGICRAQDIGVTVNGSPVQFAGVGPRSVQGRVMVPLRGVLEKLGAFVGWDSSTRTAIAQKGDIDLQLRIGDRTARVNGREVLLDVPAMVIAGSTMVPLRFMGEALGADVKWDNATRTVQIFTTGAGEGQPSPPPVQTPAPPTQPPAQPEIDSFRHNAKGWVRAGQRLEVTMEGTPGGNASFQIPGVAEKVEMSEISPGRYRGAWTVPAQEAHLAISDASVLGQLEVKGRERLIQAGDTVAVDTVSPTISALTPEPNSRIASRQPSISLMFDDGSGSGIDNGKVRLRVNGSDRTGVATITSAFLSYRPDKPLPAGENTVAVSARDKAGNPVSKTWRFSITGASEVIKSLTHNADKNLEPGDVLTVRMTGAPGGRATFSIGNIRKQAMQEQSPGVYAGEYTIRKGDNLSNEAIIGVLTVNGQTYTIETKEPIKTVTGPPDAPVIQSPARQSTVQSPLVISGTAAPNGRVHLKIEYRSTVLGAIDLKGTLSEQIVNVDSKGKFKSQPVDLDTLVAGKGTEYTITATAINSKSQRSKAIVIKVTRS